MDLVWASLLGNITNEKALTTLFVEMVGKFEPETTTEIATNPIVVGFEFGRSLMSKPTTEKFRISEVDTLHYFTYTVATVGADRGLVTEAAVDLVR